MRGASPPCGRTPRLLAPCTGDIGPTSRNSSWGQVSQQDTWPRSFDGLLQDARTACDERKGKPTGDGTRFENERATSLEGSTPSPSAAGPRRPARHGSVGNRQTTVVQTDGC